MSWTPHSASAVQLEMLRLAGEGFYVEDVRATGWRVTCTCSTHLRWIATEVAMVGYETRLRAWFMGQDCYPDPEPIAIAAHGLFRFESTIHTPSAQQRQDLAERAMWGLVAQVRTGKPVHSPAVAVDLSDGTAVVELCPNGAITESSTAFATGAYDAATWAWSPQ